MAVDGESKAFAFVGAFFTIIGFVIVLLARRDDSYAMFYAKQGLVLFGLQVVAGVGSMIPFIGWFLIGPIASILFVVLWIMAWINSLSGELKETFLIGPLANKIDL